MIRAKFRVSNMEIFDDAEVVYMEAVYSDDKTSANYSWSQFTPSGNLRMNINNPLARNKFKINQEYYLDFTEA